MKVDWAYLLFVPLFLGCLVLLYGFLCFVGWVIDNWREWKLYVVVWIIECLVLLALPRDYVGRAELALQGVVRARKKRMAREAQE
jgi:hypothetical protein